MVLRAAVVSAACFEVLTSAVLHRWPLASKAAAQDSDSSGKRVLWSLQRRFGLHSSLSPGIILYSVPSLCKDFDLRQSFVWNPRL